MPELELRLNRLQDEIREIRKEIRKIEESDFYESPKIPDNEYCRTCGSMVGYNCRTIYKTPNPVEKLHVISLNHWNQMVAIDDMVKDTKLYYDRINKAVYEYICEHESTVIMRKWGQLK